MAEWFSRPIKIKTYSWLENTRINDDFNPWYDYFNNPEIRNKLRGFSRLQATMHLKLIVNASPYQYGLGIMSYLPMAPESSIATFDNRWSGGVTDELLTGEYTLTGGTTPGNLMVYTCRPHALFHPQDNSGCEMTLPFCYYKNWLNLDSSLTELQQMGRIRLYTPMDLLTAGTASINPVTVTIYAWCDMHKVAGPSYVVQAKDEYGDRPVSTAMSVASGVAKSLSTVPQLGPYAMATSTALASLGTAARWFGYTNPPIISDTHSTALNYMPNFASPEISSQYDKISLDPKCEVTVDSRTVGLDGVDHMAISHLVSRSVSYNMADWSPTMTVATPLLIQHVTPMVFCQMGYVAASTGLNAKAIQMTPGCQVGTLFDFWSGNIKYKFTALASQFHRGRLMLTYEPDGFLSTYTDASYTGPRVISKIWDISECPTLEFEVPWMSANAMLRTGGLRAITSLSSSAFKAGYFINSEDSLLLPQNFGYLDAMHNGTITISVLNTLMSSSITAPVKLMCSIDCSNVEYFTPREIGEPVSSYRLQGPDDTLAAEPQQEVYAKAPNVVSIPTKHVIYTGELVRSVRTLMHRANYNGRFTTFPSRSQLPFTVGDRWIPTITWGTTPSPASFNAFTSSLLLPMLPYTTGTLPALFSYDGYGTMYKDGSTAAVYGAAPSATVVPGINIGIPTMTAYLYPSYMGWRGSSTYHVRANEDAARSGVLTDLSISKANRAKSTYISGAPNVLDWKCPIVWRISSTGDVTQTAAVDAVVQRENYVRKVTPVSYNVGQSGSAMTNFREVDVVSANIPYQSNYRMLPCGPLANYQMNVNANAAPWSTHDRNTDYLPIQSVSVNATVNNAANFTLSSSAPILLPTLDVYHRAGPDFTLFWYLNPPVLHVYAGTDAWPVGWT